jgi:uncharacterized protein YrrD
MTGEPVAWRVIERGWSVVDADGNEIGKVDQVTGDIEGDIFDGITVGDGGSVLTRVRYVPCEHVAAITRGEIVLDLRADEVAGLEPYSEPVSKRLADLAPEPDESGQGGTPGGRLGMSPNRGLGGILLGGLFRRRF